MDRTKLENKARWLATVAHHEAGHAIAAFEVGMEAKSLSIVPDDESAGRYEHESYFSDEDVEALVPHVVSAMAQVTPEEVVVFQRSNHADSQKRKTTGTIYVKEELLYLTIKELGKKHIGPAITFHKGNRGGEIPDQTGLRDVQLSFSPDAVRRQVIEGASSLMSYSPGKTLVLDYKSLLSS